MTVNGSAENTTEQRHAWHSAPRGAMLYDRKVGVATPALLVPASYGDRAQPVTAGGRQAAWFVENDGWSGVLRGYRRGGLIARVSREAYVWQGEARTRSFREYRLLAMMREHGLRVPAPLAAGYWRQGLLTYRASILIERIPDVRPLAHSLDEPIWDSVAEAIAAMHRLGVWHADLNAFNILIDANAKAWIIDFDRGTAGGVSPSQRRGNLLRLRRSLEKVGGAKGVALWNRLDDCYRAMSS